MKFKTFVRYFGERSILADFFNRLVDELNTGLSRLTFVENFECYKAADVTIANGAEEDIAHNLGVVPSGRLIIRQSGDGRVLDGDTEWTKTHIYLKNAGASSTTITVLIFK